MSRLIINLCAQQRGNLSSSCTNCSADAFSSSSSSTLNLSALSLDMDMGRSLGVSRYLHFGKGMSLRVLITGGTAAFKKCRRGLMTFRLKIQIIESLGLSGEGSGMMCFVSSARLEKYI